MDTGKQVDVIYTDFSKAFDTVSHSVLLSKLSDYGLSSSTLELFSSYLSNRQQYVKFKKCKSSTFVAKSGVPQGSNLGPLLFLIFINDLPTILQYTECLLYADDVKIFKTLGDTDDCELIQSDLNKLNEWCQLNKLYLNISKCKCLSFTRKQSAFKFNYTIDNIQLERCDTIRDLGVIFQGNLTFKMHIEGIINDAYRMLGLIMRYSKDLYNINVIFVLFNSFVRSKLEYAAVIWNPLFKLYTKKIEMIQSKFLRYLHYKFEHYYPTLMPYRDLTSYYNVKTLQCRREAALLVFVYKLFHGYIDSSNLLSQFNIVVPNLKTRSKNITFTTIIRPTTYAHDCSPVSQMIQLLNKHLLKFPELDFFNIGIRKYMSSCFNE